MLSLSSAMKETEILVQEVYFQWVLITKGMIPKLSDLTGLMEKNWSALYWDWRSYTAAIILKRYIRRYRVCFWILFRECDCSKVYQRRWSGWVRRWEILRDGLDYYGSLPCWMRPLYSGQTPIGSWGWALRARTRRPRTSTVLNMVVFFNINIAFPKVKLLINRLKNNSAAN